jgi:hypothetical protein
MEEIRSLEKPPTMRTIQNTHRGVTKTLLIVSKIHEITSSAPAKSCGSSTGSTPPAAVAPSARLRVRDPSALAEHADDAEATPRDCPYDRVPAPRRRQSL